MVRPCRRYRVLNYWLTHSLTHPLTNLLHLLTHRAVGAAADLCTHEIAGAERLHHQPARLEGVVRTHGKIVRLSAPRGGEDVDDRRGEGPGGAGVLARYEQRAAGREAHLYTQVRARAGREAHLYTQVRAGAGARARVGAGARVRARVRGAPAR